TLFGRATVLFGVTVDLRLLLQPRDLRIDAVDLRVDLVDLLLDVLRPLVAGVGVEQIAGFLRQTGALVPQSLDIRHGDTPLKKPRKSRASGVRWDRRLSIGRVRRPNARRAQDGRARAAAQRRRSRTSVR